MSKPLAILIGLLIAARVLAYAWAYWRWTRTQGEAWGSMSKRGSRG